MEKIKLMSGKELMIIVCGVLAAKDTITIKFLPGSDTLDVLNDLLSNPTETGRMILLSDAGEELAIYVGYTELASISLETDAVISYTQEAEQDPIIGKLVTVVLRKPDQITQRVTALEEAVDTLVMESLGL